MKLFFLIGFLGVYQMLGAMPAAKADSLSIVIGEWQMETRKVISHHLEIVSRLDYRNREILTELDCTQDISAKVNLLLEKEKNSIEIRRVQAFTNSELAKIRYLKGLQIIKILYEKVLGLDHHFAGVRTLSEINKISNPNQYPEFTRFRELVLTKREKRMAFDVPAILGGNPVVTVIHTLTTLITNGFSKEEKEKELQKIECILDFTIRMQNDLNTIYFETSFLQSSNEKIKQDIEVLFRDYAKPIGYNATLENCRANDEWEDVTKKTEEYLKKLRAASGSEQYRMQVDIEFPIDRLMQFINQYNTFIDQGGKFYEKFRIILNSYENEKQCETKLPLEYQKLRADIDLAVNKFNVAYKPVEINGSKMKEILYGLNEFD